MREKWELIVPNKLVILSQHQHEYDIVLIYKYGFMSLIEHSFWELHKKLITISLSLVQNYAKQQPAVILLDFARQQG